MAKLNIDEKTQLSDAIEFTLDGKDYVVKKVTTDLLKEVTKMGEENRLDAPAHQLAVLTGVDASEFLGTDLRKVNAALEFITETIREGIKTPKNS